MNYNRVKINQPFVRDYMRYQEDIAFGHQIGIELIANSMFHLSE